MHDLFIWVPLKGWKLIRKFKDRNDAVSMAAELEPLETKISSPSGSTYAGRLCMPNFETPAQPGHN